MPPYDLPQYRRYAAYQPRDDRDYQGPRGRSRSPPRYHEYDNRSRSRSPGPYRRPARPHQGDRGAPHTNRRQHREPKNPNGIFKGLKIHCFSTQGGTNAVMKLRWKMMDQGAIGEMEIEKANIIIIHGPQKKIAMTVKPDLGVSPITSGKRPDLAQIYNSYATRVVPDRDPQRANRKCVIQAEWAYQCLEKRKLLPEDIKDDFEIQVDNSTLFPRPQEAAPEAMEDIRPDTPPIPSNPLPDILTEQLPSFEYRQSGPVPSTTRKVPEVRSLTDHWKPEVPTVVSATPEMSKVRRIAVQQGWSDPMSSAPVPKPPAVVPDLPTSASIPPARLPVKVSVDPRLKNSPVCGSARPTAAAPPRVTPAPASTPPVPPIPATTQQNAEPTSRPSSTLPQISVPDLSDTAEATQELPEVLPTIPKHQSHPARTGVNGVFARGQDMPWLFHVCGDDKTGITAMMIKEFGGGQIAPIDLASTVVIPESGVREAKTEEIGNIVKSVGFGREVVSIDWVSRCIKDDRLVDYDTYRITLPSIQTPTETPMDVETTVEEAPGPEPAPAVEMEVEAVPASVPGPMVQMEVAASPAPAPPVIQVEPLPASPSAINSPHQRPLSLKPRKRNATAGPSGTRHSTAPRTIEIIMIDDDESDDDFVMLDTPPIIVKKSVTPDIKRKLSHVEDRYPTPPMTPLAPDNERTRSPSQERLDTTITPIAVETASEEYDPSDHIPLQRPQKRKPFTEMPLGLITDPEQRERDVQTHVPLYWRKKFRIMEKELHEWAKEDFKGPVVSFDARMFAKYPTKRRGCWATCFREFRTLYHQSVPGLIEKGNKNRRGPKDPGDTPEPEPSTL